MVEFYQLLLSDSSLKMQKSTICFSLKANIPVNVKIYKIREMSGFVERLILVSLMMPRIFFFIWCLA